MQLLYRSKKAEDLKGMLKKMLSCPWLQHTEREEPLPIEGFTSRAVAGGLPQDICSI